MCILMADSLKIYQIALYFGTYVVYILLFFNVPDSAKYGQYVGCFLEKDGTCLLWWAPPSGEPKGVTTTKGPLYISRFVSVGLSEAPIFIDSRHNRYFI